MQVIPWMYTVFQIKVVAFLCCIFSVGLSASPRQTDSINIEYMNLHVGRAVNGERHVEAIVNRAYELIGTPYRWGGASVGNGFDCSGLLVYLFRSEAGIHIPRTTSSMLDSKSKFIGRSSLKAGDVVFFKHNGRQRMKHVGIYIGGGRFIHSPRAGKHVRIDSLSNKYWNRSYFTARRFH